MINQTVVEDLNSDQSKGENTGNSDTASENTNNNATTNKNVVTKTEDKFYSLLDYNLGKGESTEITMNNKKLVFKNETTAAQKCAQTISDLVNECMVHKP